MRFIGIQNLWLIWSYRVKKIGVFLFLLTTYFVSSFIKTLQIRVFSNIELKTVNTQSWQSVQTHGNPEDNKPNKFWAQEHPLIFEDFFVPHFQQIKSNLWFSFLLLKSSKNERRHAGLTLRYLSCAVTLLSPSFSYLPRSIILLHDPMYFSLW